MLTDSSVPQTVIDICPHEVVDASPSPSSSSSSSSLPSSTPSPFSIDTSLTSMPYLYINKLWDLAGDAGKFTLDRLDYVGEKLADFFGITAPKYGMYLEQAIFEAQKQQQYLVETSVTSNARRKNPYFYVPDKPKHLFSTSFFSSSSSSSSTKSSTNIVGEI